MNWRSFMMTMCMALLPAVLPGRIQQVQAAPVLNPAVDLSKPNFAYSPPLRKFVDSLPGLGAVARTPGSGSALGANTLGQYIPIATTGVLPGFPNDDYYEIALVEYREQLHSDLPAVLGTWPNQTGGTKLRGYVQLVQGTINFASPPHYLGPIILATKNRPVRIKFTNMLPLNASGGKLFLPVDTTIMGAGMGPLTAGGAPCDPATQACASYTENRATIHLHGGLPPWISDGTAHQWITPAGEATPFVKGASQQNVPDMAVPSAGSATFYWTNQQSGRLMFYHDHALGLTGLNVYAGEAAGYLISDPTEETALLAAGVPTDLPHIIPLVIQDKTFVNAAVAKHAPADPLDTDPLWQTANWGGLGSLWFPHVYEPNQDPTSLSGANPLGRWDYGPWFWPVFPGTIPPAVSHVPEAYMDTPVVNGNAYPYLEVAAAPYRMRILNAANDRMLNLQLYQADVGYTTAATGTATLLPIDPVNGGSIQTIAVRFRGVGYPPLSTPMVHISGGGGYGAWATATVDGTGVVTAITVTNGGAGYISAPTITVGGSTEVRMIPAVPNAAISFPQVWKSQTPGMTPDILDSRLSGVPDPSMRGPAMIQIGTEGGLLPGPVLLPNTPVGFEQNKRNIVVLNILEKTLFMAPAERADVIVDFSNFAGKTIILYNDSPAPVPASDPRYDFYTGNPDYSLTGGLNDQGGAPSTLPGYGPNTRTIMQFRVAAGPNSTAPVDDYNPVLLTTLTTALPAIFKTSQDAPVVPETAYNAIGYTGGAAIGPVVDTFARIQNLSLTFTPYGTTTPITMAMKNPTIQELFDPQGRMNATLGVELPFTGALIQTTVPLGFKDPTTESIKANETQLWKITHNGVDTHGIHFHLVNVQVVNRVGWDGTIRPTDPNELGWKDTVRMNPLEDIIVAMRAKVPSVPFGVPNNIRPLDPTMKVGTTFESLDPITGGSITVTNAMTNFGHEYTWHCHLLGHEENDMMRPFVLTYPHNDFNADSTTDIIWTNTADATNNTYLVWAMNGVTKVGADVPFTNPGTLGVLSPGVGWALVATGDFDHDGKPDLLWRKQSTGENKIWFMDGAAKKGEAVVTTILSPWVVAGTGDFNNDGNVDILWRNPTTATNNTFIWYMKGATRMSSSPYLTNMPQPWVVAGVADFNNDGKPDILWRNPTTATNNTFVWYMNGATRTGSSPYLTNMSQSWVVVGVSDFNNDGKPDILWRNPTTNSNNTFVWYMDGVTRISSSPYITPNLAKTWQIVGK